ncbi:MAG: hypothetical protein HYZ29_31015 [Myxococcales bacterium]|nr:hypothetical protein [Myxococcales bacterium]
MSRLAVSVLVSVKGKDVPLDQVRDPAVVRAFRQLADDVGQKLATVSCPVHKKGPTQVRLAVDKGGNADLRYESCCLALRDAVGKKLG